MLSSNHHLSSYTKLVTVLNKEDWQSMRKSMSHYHLSLGRCNPQVARLRVYWLPSWIPQVGYYEPDSSYARNKPYQGVRPEYVLCL